MALPASGVITLANIQTEFGGTNPIGLSEYYRSPNGLTTANNTNVPLSGAIALSNFYNGINVVPGNSGILTSGSSFTLPATSGLTIQIIAIAGGGGGGGGSGRTSYSGYFTGGGGGGAGADSRVTANVTPGQVITFSIGGGGAGGAARDGIFSSGSNGTAGTATTVSISGTQVAQSGSGGGGLVSPSGTPGSAGTTIYHAPRGPQPGLAAGTNTTVGGLGAIGYVLNTTIGLSLTSIITYGAYGTSTGEGSGVFGTSGTIYGAGGSGGGCSQSDVYSPNNIHATAGTTGAVFIWWGY
jgi:hypothetical protein